MKVYLFTYSYNDGPFSTERTVKNKIIHAENIKDAIKQLNAGLKVYNLTIDTVYSEEE